MHVHFPKLYILLATMFTMTPEHDEGNMGYRANMSVGIGLMLVLLSPLIHNPSFQENTTTTYKFKSTCQALNENFKEN